MEKIKHKNAQAIDRITIEFNAAETREDLRARLGSFRVADLADWLRQWRGSPFNGVDKLGKIEIICGLSRKVQEDDKAQRIEACRLAGLYR